MTAGSPVMDTVEHSRDLISDLSRDAQGALIDAALWLYHGFFIPGDHLLSFLSAHAPRVATFLARDAAGYVEALRGRGVVVEGVRGRARLISPLVAGSLERSLNLAESMEARGFGRPGRTRAPSPPWTVLDRLAIVAAVAVVVMGAVWL